MRCRVRHWSFDAARAVYAYRGGAAALIGAYKFGGHRSLSRLLAEVLLRELEESWPGLPVVPVPYRREKIRTRGWDQVEELCLRLEGRGVEAARVLERLPSGEQKKLGLEERFENAKIAYRVRRGAAVPSRLVLIDDVFTTGATAEACAAALKSRGASFVAFLSLAAD
jgi:ComF family protein